MKYLLLGALFVVAGCVPKMADASLTSTNFSIEKPQIGTTRTVMSSSNFSIVSAPIKSVSLAPRESTTTVATTTAEEEGTSGSTRVITTVVRDMPIIFGDAVSPIVAPIAIRGIEVPQTDLEKEENVTPVILEEIGSMTTNEGVSERDMESFLATVLKGDTEGFFSALKALFDERGPRALVLCGVLLILFLLRTYTAIGRRLSPF